MSAPEFSKMEAGFLIKEIDRACRMAGVNGDFSEVKRLAELADQVVKAVEEFDLKYVAEGINLDPLP